MSERGPIIPDALRPNYERFHFAPAFEANGTIYVSGVIGVGPDGTVPDDPGEEFAAAFHQLAGTLEHAGSSLADIVELTSFHVGLAELGAFMAAKDAVIGEPYPAWTAIGCTGLAIPGARVEVKATAVRR